MGAAGIVVAHFDDDDIYTPEYLSLMLSALRDGSDLVRLDVHVHSEHPDGPPERRHEFAADAATMSSWHTFNLSRLAFGVCDPDKQLDRNTRHDWTLGMASHSHTGMMRGAC